MQAPSKHPHLRERRVQLGGGRGVRRQSNQPQVAQIVDFGVRPPRKRITDAYGEHPRQLHHHPLLNAPHGRPDSDPREIQVAVGERGETPPDWSSPVRELRANVGCWRRKATTASAMKCRTVVAPVAIRTEPVSPSADPLELPQREIQPGDALRGGGLQHAPGLGRYDTPRVPFQQGEARLPLQPARTC